MRQDAIFSFFSEDSVPSVIQGITAMSECLSWKRGVEGEARAQAGERSNSAALGHLCIKIVQNSIFDCDPTDVSLKM